MLRLGLALMLPLASGCRDGLGPTEGVTAVAFESHPGDLVVGQSVQLAPVPLGGAGQRLDIICVTEFATSDPSVAVVSADGQVTAMGPGVVTITARLNTVPGDIVLHVVEPVAGGTLTITPPSATTGVGHTVGFTAELRDASGTLLTGVTIGWSSSNPTIATVDGNGLATGLAPGTVTIRAQARGLTATASLTVTDATVATISVSPAQASIATGAAVTFTATVRDAGGNVLTGRQITWQSSNASVAAIESTGANTATVRGMAEGTATITATSEGESATATVTVTAGTDGVGSISVQPGAATLQPEETLQLVAEVRDTDGAIIAGAPVTFSSSNTAVASVSAAGVVTAHTEGNATMTATSGGMSVTSAITVTTVPVGSIEIVPAEPVVNVGQSLQLTAIVRDADGNVLTGRAVVFQSAAPGVAQVTADGLLTGVTEGTAAITATSGGQSATVQAQVTAAAVASVELQPAEVSIPVGTTAQLTATVRDAQGNVLDGRTVVFSSSNEAVATVSASGVVQGVAEGTATITGTSEGQSGTATVTVTAPPAVGSVTVEPEEATLEPDDTLQLDVEVRDTDGNIIVNAVVSFSSSDPNVASVTDDGLVTAHSEGTVTITVSAGGVEATVEITVEDPVASIEISPADPQVCVGESLQLTAIVRNAAGQVLTGREVFFESSAPLVAEVTAAGLLTGIAEGTAEITATSEGQSTTVTANICVAAVASIELEPATATIAVDATVQLTATLRDALGNILEGRPVTFTSSNLAVATVTADGTVVGLLPGTTNITATADGQTAVSVITVVAP